ncbi:hypothetical protein CYMTET_35429, partial [Cymbomonas tetramitiformis]
MTFTSLDISAFDDPDYTLNFTSEFKGSMCAAAETTLGATDSMVEILEITQGSVAVTSWTLFPDFTTSSTTEFTTMLQTSASSIFAASVLGRFSPVATDISSVITQQNWLP